MLERGSLSTAPLETEIPGQQNRTNSMGRHFEHYPSHELRPGVLRCNKLLGSPTLVTLGNETGTCGYPSKLNRFCAIWKESSGKPIVGSISVWVHLVVEVPSLRLFSGHAKEPISAPWCKLARGLPRQGPTRKATII